MERIECRWEERGRERERRHPVKSAEKGKTIKSEIVEEGGEMEREGERDD